MLENILFYPKPEYILGAGLLTAGGSLVANLAFKVPVENTLFFYGLSVGLMAMGATGMFIRRSGLKLPRKS